MAAEVVSKAVQPIILAELYFDSGTLRLWTGVGNLDWNGNTFTGGGDFIGISPIEETQELQAKGIVATLNGMPSTIIALALGERCRGRPFKLYLGSANTTQYVATEDEPGRILLEDGSGYVLVENALLGTPYRIFSGLMDYMECTDNAQTADIRVSVENILIVGQRAKVSRYTAEDQRKRFPADKGFEFINQLQDKEIVW